ncbi:serine hydrolase domain-containing protein [Parafilimonas terrae]|jgi:CubicO group peptidase (beta-lactamase class C family)|uniref:CubicO group peptidase, beta-lactamase class C family n=1 Tax=Parafilimonas terrae TaxID=1465490 RepID=A0A1I5WWE5_9BACT|nr:serine hydrolase domain-containing protein [Parafilimonas terrae]SFQ24062.1 CubicO group peptidase, beta-lactamase class C family [Parafilimonas terrae]
MKKHNYFKQIIFTGLLMIAGCIADAQNSRIETRIDSVMKAYKMVGLSVAVVKKGDIVYTHSFGLKNIATNTPLTNDDIFRIASISKSFSATAIMQLVEAKKLSLNDDVSKLIGFEVRNPKFPGKVITLKMLMSHTSSLNDSQGYFTLDSINPAKTANAYKCYSNYAPGEGYAYCNLNYNMVGTIIERVSGERFDKYIKAHILDKLGLYGGYEVGALDASKFATLYEYDSATKQFIADDGAYNPRTAEINNYIMGYSTPIFSPTGGMKISATDLAKYMTMHAYFGKYKGVKIISKKSAKIMQTPVSDGEGGYGLAILTADNTLIPGEVIKGHTGSAYGLYSSMFFHPKKKFGIVAITNGFDVVYDSGFNPALKAIDNILYEELIK